MVTTTRTSTALLLVIGLLTVPASLGCSMLQDAPATSLADIPPTAGAAEQTVVVELRRGKGKSEHLRAPLKESMLVQDALKGSGAIQRFHRMNVVLVRMSPNGQQMRLPVAFNPSARRVVDANNYALHGGDWIEVTEDTSTSIDRILETALEPLRPMMRSYRD